MRPSIHIRLAPLALAAMALVIGACSSSHEPEKLSYSSPTYLFEVDYSGTTGTPSVEGGTPLGPGAFSLDTTLGESLPAGVTLNVDTGEISGMPAQGADTGSVDADGEYRIVVVATNPDGSVSTTIEITVLPERPKILSYSDGTTTYYDGDMVIMGVNLTASGITLNATTDGDVYNCACWTIDPPLPSGLAFDADTGTISGVPDTPTFDPSGGYLVTVAGPNPVHPTGSFRLHIEVQEAPSSISYGTLGSMELGVAIPSFDPVVGGASVGALTYMIDFGSDPLPEGIDLHPSTGRISGTPLEIGAKFYVTVRVFNYDGYATTDFDFPFVDLLESAYAYALSEQGFLMSYVIDLDGKLLDNGIVPTGYESQDLALTLDGSVLYVLNKGFDVGQNSVQRFDVDPATGGLTPTATQTLDHLEANPFLGVGTPVALAVDPLGDTVYVSYVDDGGNALLAYMQGSNLSPFPYPFLSYVMTEDDPVDLLVAPDGESAYLLLSSGDIQRFEVHEPTGALIPLGVTSGAVAGARDIEASLDGDHVFVANGSSGSITVYDRNTDSWLLTSPTTIGAYGSSVDDLWLSAVLGDLRLYAASEQDETVDQYEMGWGGTPVFQRSLPAGNAVAGAVTLGDEYVYVLENYRHHLRSYDTTTLAYGDLNPIDPLAQLFIGEPKGIVIAPRRTDRPNPVATNLYIATAAGIENYELNGSGVPTFYDNVSYGAPYNHVSVARRAGTNGMVYAATQSGVEAYRIGGGGELYLSQALGLGERVNYVAAEPGARKAWAVMDYRVAVFDINPSGTLSLLSTFDQVGQTVGPVDAGAVALHPSGGMLFVLEEAGRVEGYLLDSATGGLLDSVELLVTGGGKRVSVDFSGRFLYVTNVLGDTIETFKIEAVDDTIDLARVFDVFQTPGIFTSSYDVVADFDGILYVSMVRNPPLPPALASFRFNHDPDQDDLFVEAGEIEDLNIDAEPLLSIDVPTLLCNPMHGVLYSLDLVSNPTLECFHSAQGWLTNFGSDPVFGPFASSMALRLDVP